MSRTLQHRLISTRPTRLTASPQRFKSFVIRTDTPPETLRATIALIGRGIRDGANYIPIRQHSANLASRAGPKDYLGQLKHLYNDFVTKRWRYVHDPNRTELLAISGPAIFGQVLGFNSKPPSRGYGDCDDATVALGAMAESIGLKSRIVTIAPMRSNQLFSHVFPQIKIPKLGWVTADAVVYPKRALGFTPPYKRMAIWDTKGNLIAARGSFPPVFHKAFRAMVQTDVSGLVGSIDTQGESEMSMQGLSFDDFEDYGLENFGLAGTDNQEPEDWAQQGLLSFGVYVDAPLPMINNDRLGLMMEYDEDDEVGALPDGSPVVRTKMLEMDPIELAYIYNTGRPQPGMVALADDGDVYQWVEGPMGGFFKKLFKKVRKGVRRVVGKAKKIARGVSRAAKRLIKRLPGGKYLVKVYDKIKRVAMKVTRPLVKMLGKWGKRLAPIAAMIPGYGPVIAVALAKAGTVAKLLTKYGVVTDKKGRPRFKSGKQAKRFQSALVKEASKQKRRGGRVKRRVRRVSARHMIPSARVIARGSRRYRQKLGEYGMYEDGA